MRDRIDNKDENIIKELSSSIIFKEKSDVILYEQNLDSKSVYSYVFLCSIYHDNVEELKDHLKLQFHSESKYNISKEEYLSTKDEYFDKNFSDLNIKEKDENDFNRKEFKPVKIEEGNSKKPLTSVFFISLLPGIFQISFLYSFYKILFNEYLGKDNSFYLTMQLKIIRYLIYLCLLFKTYIEFINGKRIFTYGVYNRYLFRSQFKRFLSVLMGLVQISINLLVFFYFSILFNRAKTVIQCIQLFCVFITVSQADNWIGEFYMNSSKEFSGYTRGDFKQICLVNNRKCRISFIDFILYVIFTFIIIFSFLCSL
jgi:hypothetical protein